MKRHARYERWNEGKGQRFRIRASNGKIVGPTEQFSGHIKRATEALRRAMDEADQYPVVVVPAPKKRGR